MILTHKCLLGDIFLTRRLSKLLAFCEFMNVNFDPWLPPIYTPGWRKTKSQEIFLNMHTTSKIVPQSCILKDFKIT